MNYQILKEIDTIEAITAWHSIANKVVDEENRESNAMKLVLEEYREMMEAYMGDSDKDHIMHEIADLIFVLVNLIYVHGYSPASVLRTVTESNYTKFFNKLHYNTFKDKIDKHCEEKDLVVTNVNAEVMCVTDKDYKIKKGIFYQPVKYKQFVKLDV